MKKHIYIPIIALLLILSACSLTPESKEYAPDDIYSDRNSDLI